MLKSSVVHCGQEAGYVADTLSYDATTAKIDATLKSVDGSPFVLSFFM